MLQKALLHILLCPLAAHAAGVDAIGMDTASTVVQQYQTQLEQLRLQTVNTQGVDASVVSSNLQSIETAMANLTNYKTSLNRLSVDLSEEGNLIDRRLAEARLQNMNWSEYLDMVNKEAASGSQRAKARLQYEQSVLERVNQDYQFARDQAAMIPASLGAHQAIQLMNNQMNRVVTQNAQMIELLIRTYTATTDRDQADQANRAAQGNLMDAYMKRQQAMEKRQEKTAK
jgi:type IV secretion system protein TrbJ